MPASLNPVEALPALVAVGVGSAFGGGARFLVGDLVARRFGATFPWGTLVVNVTGAFLLGLLAGLVGRGAFVATPYAWEAAALGFLGSYTTVSALSLQTLLLLRSGDRRRAAANVALSLLLGLGAAALGLWSGRA